MNYTTTMQAGYVPGQDLSAGFHEIRELKRQGQVGQAIASLLELIDATEEDSLFTGLGVTPAYYEELALIFRERREYAKEIEVLSRYLRQRHTLADARQEALKKRLEQARKLLLKHNPMV